ncbi:UNVERIFIED_CONTAM: hypothetical protein RMT77_003872 [Armadillidium vulgare]
MDDLTADSSPIPEVRTSEPDSEDVTGFPDSTSSANGSQPATPSKKIPQVMHLSGCSKVHIGPLYNCIDPASVRTPPPGAKSPVHSFSHTPKRPPKAHVEALLESTREVNDAELDLTSNHIGYSWRQLGRSMNYSNGQLDNIDQDNHRLVDKAYSLLSQWRDRESKQASVANLTRLLMTAEAYDAVIRLRP